MTHDSNKDPGDCIAEDKEGAPPPISADGTESGMPSPIARAGPVSSAPNAQTGTRVSA